MFPQPIAPIRIEAPSASLLTVARRLPAGTDWRSGVAHLPNGCQAANNYPTCEVEDPGPEKCGVNTVARAEFDSWPIYIPDGCGSKPYWAEDWKARSFEAIEAYTAWACSRELQNGASTANPSLESTAVDLGPGGAYDPTTAISVLLRALSDTGITGGGRILHIPWWLIPAFERDYLVMRTGSVLTAAGGTLLVSPGPGYTGASPAGDLPGINEGYIYLTGSVEYEVSEPMLLPPEQMDQNRLTNNVEVYAERFAVYRFDPCNVYAINVGVCANCGGA